MAGWDVTLADFRQLTGYPDYRPAIAPLFATQEASKQRLAELVH